MCEDLIRGFEEFDEKLPMVAKVIVQRGINFGALTNNSSEIGEEEVFTPAEGEAFSSILAIMKELIECVSEMTHEEFEHYFDILLTACELVVMVNEGIVKEQSKGKFILTSEAQ